MKASALRTTSALSLANAVMAAASLFLLFRFTIKYAGADQLGSWALMTALLAFARFTDGGAALAMIRQVALDRKAGPTPVGDQLWAGLALGSGPVLLLCMLISAGAAIFAPPGFWGHSLENRGIIVWGALLFSMTNSMAGILAGCLDGMGFMRQRIEGSILANLVLAGGAVFAVPRAGLTGFVLTNVLYGFVLVGLYFVIIARRGGGLATTRERFMRTARSSASLVMSNAVLGIARAGFEPATKLFVGHFGGLASVAVFEIVNRIAVQLRQFTSASLQPVSYISVREGHGLTEDLRRTLYRYTLVSIVLNFGAAAAQILSAPLVSLVIFGALKPEITTYSVLLAVSGFINMACAVGYYSTASSGKMRLLVVVHLLMLAGNVALGAILGSLFGSYGAVLGWAITFAASGVIVLAAFLRNGAFPIRSCVMIVASIIAGALLLFGIAQVLPYETALIGRLWPHGFHP